MRNYAAEMRELIDKKTADGPYEPVVVATEIVAELQDSDPDLLNGYLAAHAIQIIREAINARDHSHRMTARKDSVRERMQEITKAVGSGEIHDIKQVREQWLSATFTLKDGMRHELRTMKKDDLIYVARDYERRAEENKMEATFMRLLAKKIGNRPVGDVLSEVEIVNLRRGLAQFK